MQDAWRAAIQGGGMLTRFNPVARGLDADQAHSFILDERVEQADCIRATANTGHDCIRQTPFALQDLRPRFLANHTLEIAHQLRIRMRAGGGSNAIERVVHIRHPVAQRFIHGVLQGARA